MADDQSNAMAGIWGVLFAALMILLLLVKM
jgi:uncharacterized integral membrane protein